jgi:hypothetical protein
MEPDGRRFLSMSTMAVTQRTASVGRVQYTFAKARDRVKWFKTGLDGAGGVDRRIDRICVSGALRDTPTMALLPGLLLPWYRHQRCRRRSCHCCRRAVEGAGATAAAMPMLALLVAPVPLLP